MLAVARQIVLSPAVRYIVLAAPLGQADAVDSPYLIFVLVPLLPVLKKSFFAKVFEIILCSWIVFDVMLATPLCQADSFHSDGSRSVESLLRPGDPTAVLWIVASIDILALETESWLPFVF